MSATTTLPLVTASLILGLAGWQARLLASKTTERLVRRTLDETKSAGIDRNIIVVAPSQKQDLEQGLSDLEGIYFAEQQEARGLGHALAEVKRTRALPDNEPCAVVCPDESVERSCLRSMIKAYNEHKCCIVAVRKLKKGDEESYGIVCLDEKNEKPGNIRLIKTLREKPGEAMAYRNSYAIIGRYILAPEIFKGLDEISHSHQNSNIELTDELNQLALQQIVYAYLYKGDRQTISSILRRHLRDEIEKFLKHRGSPQG